MQRLSDTLVFSPSDLNAFLECAYLTRLNLEAAEGRGVEKRRSPDADLLADRGAAHERAWLERLQREHAHIVSIPEPGPGGDWDAAARETREAMAAGADVIYQGVLVRPPAPPASLNGYGETPSPLLRAAEARGEGGWRGVADFLIRIEEPSDLGAWSYEAWDTKLARHAQPKHVLQLAFYTEQVAAIQGREPDRMHIVLGTGEVESFQCRDYMAYYRRIRDSFVRSIEEGLDATPYRCGHCGLCGYREHCDGWWRERDHLTLVAGIRRTQIEKLEEVGIRTCAGLASLNGQPTGIGESALDRLRHQARLQIHSRRTGEHRYELLSVTEENGFRLLPSPSEGDVFFDMEGFPHFEPSGGLEYLFGAIDREGRFSAFRAMSRAEEKLAFEGFVDFLWNRLRRWPDLHVYHYAHYEPAALKRLMSLHATREEEVDELLRREVFVDLFQVVRRSMRISQEDYSIKRVRTFFMDDAGRGEVSDGGASILAFQRYLDTGDASILEAIVRYNEEDCVSTLRLRDWLLERKQEAERQFGVEIPFLPFNKRREKEVEPLPDEHAGLRAKLALIPSPFSLLPGSGFPGPHVGLLLSHLLDYHQREAKPQWWAYFERKKKSLDELLDDTEAISYLTPTGDPPVSVKRSLVHTLAFPDQESKLKADDGVEGPLEGGSAGTIERIDMAAGRLGLRRGKNRTEPLPRAIVAGGPVDDKPLRAAIVRVAEDLCRVRLQADQAEDVRSVRLEADQGAPPTRYRALLDILSRCFPRIRSLAPGASLQTLDLDDQKRLVADLDDSYLFLQGPPGSGKTYTGARLIVSLLRDGRRVGVTAPNHRAIHNLLDEVERVAAAEGVQFRGLKKRSVSDETAYEGRFVTSVGKNDDCASSDAGLLAGTAWLFADDCMEGRVDYLFIDEAGQMALADAVAAGTSARSIVLLGDPQQLPHVTQGVHPAIVPQPHASESSASAASSVLEHLLAGDATVAEDRGLFLARTWRMHPDVCRFVSEHSYEGRLTSAPGCELQRVDSPGLSGAGLRWIPVEHRHNAQQSREEAEAIAREVRLLVSGGNVSGPDGFTRPLTPADILVVAPYNMQVRCLREALPPDVEVATVDKFQGREAAVVFFSMASSSGDDVPRGLEFLFNRNRFNVAVSRARCLSVVVCSPALLEARCVRVEQMELVNRVCTYVYDDC